MGPLLTIGGLIALVVVLGIPMPAPWVLVVAGVVVVAWVGSVKLFPEKTCYTCKGKGALGWSRLRRTCPRCKGSGRINRMGVNK